MLVNASLRDSMVAITHRALRERESRRERRLK